VNLPFVRSTILARTLRHCREHVVYATVFSALLNLLHLAPTVYMLVVYDKAIPTEGQMTLALVSLVLLFALGTLAILDWMRSRILVRLSARLENAMAGDILATVLGDPRIPQARRTQILRDFDTFRQGLAGQTLLTLLDAPWAPIFLLAAFLLHPLLGFITLAAMILLGVLAYVNEKATSPSTSAANDAFIRAYARQDHVAASAEVVRALGMVRPLAARQLEDRREMIALQTDASFGAGGFLSLTKFLRIALQSGALGLGAYLAMSHQISGGAVIAASILMTRALAPVEQLVGGWKTMIATRDAQRRLDAVLPHMGQEAEKTRLPPAQGVLRFEGVAARPPESDRLVLGNVSFEMQPGEVVAILGPSGAGKSTLMRMAAGAGWPDRGAVRLDGAALPDWPADQLSEAIGYLPQDFVLFPGTIKDNISRFAAHKGMPAEQIDAMAVQAATAVRAHEMILRLPQGYDTEIGFNGAGLSAGQRQRIALARAFFGDPVVLILDEPNAHLDPEGEVAMIEAVRQAKARGAATLMVVHRGAAIRIADRVMVLKEGQVQSMGPAADVVPGLAAQPPRPVAPVQTPPFQSSPMQAAQPATAPSAFAPRPLHVVSPGQSPASDEYRLRA